MREGHLGTLRRVALWIEYVGTQYHGWQRQDGVCSIQETLECALEKILCHPVLLHCAGRTDKGVHAQKQIVHFDTLSSRKIDALVFGTNVFLPPDIRVLKAWEVSLDFHARYSALSRRYQYKILNRAVSSPILHQRALWFKYPLEIAPMHQAAQSLLGEQDFSALRGSECQSKTPWRCVYQASVTRSQIDPDHVIFDIEANAFLHHMVRNIVGMLLPIGQLHKPPEALAEVLKTQDRRQAGVTAPPEGLYLVDVKYPEG